MKDQEPQRVLIVDDDEQVRRMTARMVFNMGCPCLTVSSGEEGLARLAEGHFDIVLSDIAMEGMNGISFMKNARERYPHLDFIIMTAFTSEYSYSGIIDAGAIDYLAKPFEQAELAARLERAMKERRLLGQLRESERKYSALIESSPDIVYTLDPDGRFTFVGGAVEELLGFRPGELLGRHFSFIVDESDLATASWHFNERRTGERATQRLELRLKTKAGRPKPFDVDYLITELKAFGVYDGAAAVEAKTFLGTYGVARDVTERKRAEDALQRATTELEMRVGERTKELRSERDKFQGMLSALDEGVDIVNRDCIVEYQNDVLVRRFGRKIGEKCERAYGELDRFCDHCPIHEAIAAGRTERIEVVTEDQKYYEMGLSPFTDTDGEVKVIRLTRDITRRKVLQAEALRAGHLASLGELAAGVAHEINNPINGIINYAQILLDQAGGNGEGGEIPERIIKEADRVAAIVKNLLSFARDQRDEHSLALIHDILSDALGLVEKQICKDGIDLRVDVSRDLPKIRARSQQVQQVFLNIMSNARYVLNKKYPGFHKDKRIDIRCESAKVNGQDHVRVTFIDKGTGISPEVLEKICDPFFTTKPRGEGTGLGLSISYGIVKSHGGRLWFQSVEGKYTKAMVDLPVNKPGEGTDV
ncbi:MAG: response regulator [Thermodesulfobacteriota bacterium]|nr:response regulator [Thermodesulfobacteriota bacterium]